MIFNSEKCKSPKETHLEGSYCYDLIEHWSFAGTGFFTLESRVYCIKNPSSIISSN